MIKRQSDPNQMTADSRLNAVAAILAKGVSRLQKRRKAAAKESAETAVDRLDVEPETGLTEGVG